MIPEYISYKDLRDIWKEYSLGDVKLVGFLVTDRKIIKRNGAEIAVDKNMYEGKTDFEVEIEYEGITGYGEASMPPYLGETVESVMSFLGKVNLEQFSDPFQLDDILSYVDSLSPKDTAAKAAVDIALHDLVGKLLGAPWYKIWGLNKEKTPSTTFTIGIDAPDVVLSLIHI